MGIYLLSFYTRQIIREDFFFSVRDGRILLKQHTYIVFEFIACLQPFARRGTLRCLLYFYSFFYNTERFF